MRRFAEVILREPILLAFIALSAGGVWAFVELADAVGDGDSHQIDEALILALRNPADKADPIGPKWFEEVMRDFTALGGYAILTPLTCSVAIYLWLRDRGRMALLVLVAVAGGVLLSTLMKSYFDRPRPDLVPHGSYVLTKSFPSGHAMLAATTYLTLGAVMAEAEKRRSLRIFFLVIGLLSAIIVGISRVYLGVHWPTDVLAGWCAGAAWALCCWTLARIFDPSRQSDSSNASLADSTD
ncbi:MAG: phosphatase PAP2 family protein [Pirellulaceae bacterium]|nr:phosphatase PAP2 family protein [Pirellulaceae bacterium]